MTMIIRRMRQHKQTTFIYLPLLLILLLLSLTVVHAFSQTKQHLQHAVGRRSSTQLKAIFSKRRQRKQKIVDGYSDKSLSSSSIIKESNDINTPGAKLLRAYEQKQKEQKTPKDIIISAENIWKRFSQSVLSNDDDSSTETTPTPAQRLQATQPIQQALIDLQSKNPITRAFAQRKIQQWEAEEEQRLEKQKRQQNYQKFKQNIYKAKDSVDQTTKTIIALPTTVIQTAATTSETIAKIPNNIANAVDTVAQIPKDVQKYATETKQTWDQNIKRQQQAIQTVKALPKTIQESAQQTQASLERAADNWQDLASNTQQALGMAPRKPQPPKVPPPREKSTEELTRELIQIVASGAGNAAWFIGKEAVGLAAKGIAIGAQRAVPVAQQAFRQQMDTTAKQTQGDLSSKAIASAPLTTTTMASSSSSSTTETTKTTTTSPRPLQVEEIVTAPDRVEDVAPLPKALRIEQELGPDVALALQAARDALRKPTKKEIAQAKKAKQKKLAKQQLDDEVANALKLAEEALELQTDDDVKPKQ